MTSKAYKSRLIELRNAVNDSARIYRTVFVTFLLLHFYFLAIALSVDHVALFKDEILKTPILNIGIKTSVFFQLVPAIILLVYLELLLQAQVLVKKNDAYKDATLRVRGYNETLGTLLPIPLLQVVSGQWNKSKFRWVLLSMVVVMLFLLPIGTLTFIMWKFFPYQNAGISLWHKIAISAGIAIALSLYWTLLPKKKTARTLLLKRITIIGAIAIVVLIVLFTFPLFMHPAKEPNFESALWKFLYLAIPMKGKYERWHTLRVANERLYREREHSPLDVCDEKDPTFGLDLMGRSYIKADLSSSILCHARLERAQLQGAKLQGAVLKYAQLQEAQLQRASLFDAELQGADLSFAELQGASLFNAELQGAALIGAELQVADLEGAQFQGADLRGTQLQGAVLKGGQFQGAGLFGAEFQGADLSFAEFQGAALFNAEFQGAVLEGAQFQGAFSAASRQSPVVRVIGSRAFKTFKKRIIDHVDQASALFAVVFSGGMKQNDIERIVEELQKAEWGEERIRDIKKRLEPHVAEDKSNQLPEDAGAIVGKYNQAEAEEWIQEYQQALGEGSSE